MITPNRVNRQPLIPSAPQSAAGAASSAAEEIAPRGNIEEPQLVQTTGVSISSTVSLRWEEEFLKRIPQEERESHLKAIAELEHTFTEDQKDLLRKREMFEHPSKKLLILQAYLEKIIDEHDASFLFLKEAALEVDPRCEEYQLVDTGRINLGVVALLEVCLRRFFSLESLHSDIASISKFFEEAPWKSKCILMTISASWEYENDRLGAQILNLVYRNGPFIYSLRAAQKKLLILPPDFLQLVYRQKYGENAIKMIPVLGYSEIERFSNWRQRVVAIPSCMKLPPRLHGMETSGIGAFIHDSYFHCAVESSNPHRKLWVAIARNFKASIQPNTTQVLDIERLFLATILDREFFDYSRYSSKHAFWLSFVQAVNVFWNNLSETSQNSCCTSRLAEILLRFRQAFVEVWSEEQQPSVEYLKELRGDKNISKCSKLLLWPLKEMQKEAPPIELFVAVIKAFKRFPEEDFFSQFLIEAADIDSLGPKEDDGKENAS